MNYTVKQKTAGAVKKSKGKGGGSQKTLSMIAAASVFFLAAAVLLAVKLPHIASGSDSAPPAVRDAHSRAPFSMRTAVSAEIPDEFVVDETEYQGTLLLETEDAGQDYLDDTVFIGDSNTLRLYMFGLMPLKNVMGIEGMGIQSVINHPEIYWSGYNDPMTIPTAVTMTQPRRIVICFGTNNLMNKNPEWFIENYTETLDALSEAYSYSEIIIMSVPPVGANCADPSLTNKTVKEYNDALLVLAKERGLRFLNAYEELIDRNTGAMKSNYIIGDGIHLSESACEAVIKYVRTHATDTEDQRPMPLETVPARREAPPKPKPAETQTSERSNFSVSTAAGYVASGLLSDGFRAKEGDIDFESAADSMSFGFANADVKSGMELDAAKQVMAGVRTQYSSGLIAVSGYYDEDSKQHVIAVYFFEEEAPPPDPAVPAPPETGTEPPPEIPVTPGEPGNEGATGEDDSGVDNSDVPIGDDGSGSGDGSETEGETPTPPGSETGEIPPDEEEPPPVVTTTDPPHGSDTGDGGGEPAQNPNPDTTDTGDADGEEITPPPTDPPAPPPVETPPAGDGTEG